MSVEESFFSDFLIIGAGLAGSSLALKLSQFGKVILICKESLMDSNTCWAQGGIAAALGENDSYASHIQDTLIAGAGLCHEDIVRRVVMAGPQAIADLAAFGVHFTSFAENTTQSGFPFHLTQEGGHSVRRVAHVGDMTGFAIQTALSQRIQENKNITVYDFHTAVDLIVTDTVAPRFSQNRVLGAYVLDEARKKISPFLARATILATGGHGKLYLYTSNPDTAVGDGVAMAWRAGACVANLEFMQFHPTCLYHPKVKNFLISEALRGEGALLVSRSGKRIMEGLHPAKELAPRDIVARAIDLEIKKTGEPFVYLDISHKDPNFVQTHFPGIFAKCLDVGIDITKNPIPVVPAAHYSCGGVVTNECGRTRVQGLWAIGEVACTGLHGANRLASNSLLEGLAFAQFAFEDLRGLWPELKKTPVSAVSAWQQEKFVQSTDLLVTSQLWNEVRQIMWNDVGIVRSEKRLLRAAARIGQIFRKIETISRNAFPSRLLIEVRNLCTVAQLTIRCAELRAESRGTHYFLDYPTVNDRDFKKDTLLVR